MHARPAGVCMCAYTAYRLGCVCAHGEGGGGACGEGVGEGTVGRGRRDATQVWIPVKCPNLESKSAQLDGHSDHWGAPSSSSLQISWMKREVSIYANSDIRISPSGRVGSGLVGSGEAQVKADS